MTRWRRSAISKAAEPARAAGSTGSACSGHFKVLSAEIDYTERDGRTPSDHFPVTAVIEWKQADKK